MGKAIEILKKKEIGWQDIGEEFTRYVLLKTPWFQVLVHRLWCPNWHELHHDHPWSFVTLILRGGYLEKTPGARPHWRPPGTVLYRNAEFAHNVVTTGAVCWSLVVASSKRRTWGFVDETGRQVKSGAPEEEEDYA